MYQFLCVNNSLWHHCFIRLRIVGTYYVMVLSACPFTSLDLIFIIPPLQTKFGGGGGNIGITLSVHKSNGTLKLVPPSVCHKSYNLGYIFSSINDRAFIFGMHDPCDKTFPTAPCLDFDLWPISWSQGTTILWTCLFSLERKGKVKKNLTYFCCMCVF